MAKKPLLPKHGGYRRLKSFQLAQLVYDVTIRFCERYIPRNSRTRDQMVQAARSGTQNIAEGSMASGTSKKTEIKLTNVARASLEELRLDYEDFLRHRNLEKWAGDDPRRKDLVKSRPGSADDVVAWIIRTHGFDRQYGPDQRKERGARVDYAGPSANAALVLTEVAISLLERQVASLADKFEKEGGFTERLYRTRQNYRREGRLD